MPASRQSAHTATGYSTQPTSKLIDLKHRVASAIGHVANANKTQDHHGPSGGLGDGGLLKIQSLHGKRAHFTPFGKTATVVINRIGSG
jgi:hypothetical protein